MTFRRSLVILVALAGPGSAWAQSPGYTLGAQDQLQIRVFDLRTGSGEAYRWPAFDADYIYSVSAAGTLAIPLLGEIPVEGKTPAEVAGQISEKLQSKVGLATRPDASVQVAKYRPFYVSGLVQKPGDYEYRPNITVLQAVSMAGGVSRATGDALLGATRDALSNRGDLRVLTANRIALEARQARLDIEINGGAAIAWPPLVKAHQGEGDVARLMREESMLFDSRRESLQTQVEVLNSVKQLLQKQIESLDAKKVNLDHQLDLSKTELDQVSSLVAKGLAAVPRRMALEQSTAQYKSDELDLQLASLRAEQDLAKADQDILTLTNTRRNDALQEATEVRSKLAETMERIDTAAALVFQSEVRAPAVLASSDAAVASPDYSLTRLVGGKSQTVSVQEGDPVQPGDVIRVEAKPMPAGVDLSTGLEGRRSDTSVASKLD